MWYWYILIALVVIVGGFVLYAYIHPIILKNKFQTRLQAFLNQKGAEFKFQEDKKAKKIPYDFSLVVGNKTYVCKIIVIPSFSEVIVNAKTTWELRYGAGNTPGKAHPIRKYLPKMEDFMDYETEFQKVIVFTPATKKKVRYINESEMVFIKPKTNVYGVNVINDDEMEYFIEP